MKPWVALDVTLRAGQTYTLAATGAAQFNNSRLLVLLDDLTTITSGSSGQTPNSTSTQF
jgi:hypothetical protein